LFDKTMPCALIVVMLPLRCSPVPIAPDQELGSATRHNRVD